jgi:outer membrane receptor protein involved in Fe transport
MPVYPNGQPVVIPAIPPIPEMGINNPIPLPTNHQEETRSWATNQSAQVFMDVTYQLTRKLFVTGGVRGVYDMYKLNNEAEFTGGDPSILGYLTGNAPNLFFKPSANKQISKNTLSFTGKAGLQYKLNEYGNVFVNYARGQRPNVLQFTSKGEKQVLDTEILDNFDAGFKASILERVFIDAVGFYQKYKNFQSSAWKDNNYIIIDGGKATTYGFETSVNVAVVKQLELFGNYAWLHSAFDSTNTDGLEQEYAGNSFALAPEHSFTAGFNAQFNLTKNLQMFVSPSYSYKTHIYFTDANTEGLDQDAYGLLNVNGGLKLAEPKLMLSVYANNLLDEQYATSGGNTGSLFGVPTFVPGAPRMFGVKVTWVF